MALTLKNKKIAKIFWMENVSDWVGVIYIQTGHGLQYAIHIHCP